ncbi:aminomethyl-transferring glycine dehydrogenase [Candidatus Methylacidithermus pantelleriae]|uniref:glycine dehydrogenase (aminomethyl-transferring) n=1 Tax=Candidatus Methylacidithermus pantelleriae TaxID=2744239 RepID=A0A8J2BKF1_9BACT|nr:aminomethyl-transferring glycine dehydrogenase [Candidatus Methylacidithermus pantelleriae]CAF0696050.1 glycine decarboxylase [Candidatus Methylacidithermus pantelleriae]
MQSGSQSSSSCAWEALSLSGTPIPGLETDVLPLLEALGFSSLAQFEEAVIPAEVRTRHVFLLPQPLTEDQAKERIGQLAAQNRPFRSLAGLGYRHCQMPEWLRRHVWENIYWYSPYTPYQAEISQGRLEALFIFQTFVAELTHMEVANASLLDEASASAEAMLFCYRIAQDPRRKQFFASSECLPQTLAVLQNRAEALSWEVVIDDPFRTRLREEWFGALLPYPTVRGTIFDYRPWVQEAQKKGIRVGFACDPLALTILLPPGAMGADVVVGTTQRLGLPLFYGGPHAAFFSTRRAFLRSVPGRIVGLSRDLFGNPAFRLALQTREQHIRREKATSNICTAQVLPAIATAFYVLYHGREGLQKLARKCHLLARVVARAIGKDPRYRVDPGPYFDTLAITTTPERAEHVRKHAFDRGLFLGQRETRETGEILVAFDETVDTGVLETLLDVFLEGNLERDAWKLPRLWEEVTEDLPAELLRKESFCEQAIFRQYRTEAQLVRYIHSLAQKDYSLVHGLIPLGSCTMKWTPAACLVASRWEGFATPHPAIPLDWQEGYQELVAELEHWLCELTGFSSFTFQPNAGSQGELAGLLAIRRYHEHRGESHRKLCLIPDSAHGTNFASARLAGFDVVTLPSDKRGCLDREAWKQAIAQYGEKLGALMVTYPTTHGIFEESMTRLVQDVHEHGGLVYWDGANMNAILGLCRPAELGMDVGQLNLHKTFGIPHGGGGPGAGPVGAIAHVAPYLPSHPWDRRSDRKGGALVSSPLGNASLLPIVWVYLSLLGKEGVRKVSLTAILHANYVASRLDPYFPVLFRGPGGWVAHECVLDVRPWREAAGVGPEDIARRLMDYGFHAPTISWPVPGALMIEPTETETKEELDRFCEAMISIHTELVEIAQGKLDREDHPLRWAPHTAAMVTQERWEHSYDRKRGAFPLPWVALRKFWPAVGRIDHVYGDRFPVVRW